MVGTVIEGGTWHVWRFELNWVFRKSLNDSPLELVTVYRRQGRATRNYLLQNIIESRNALLHSASCFVTLFFVNSGGLLNYYIWPFLDHSFSYKHTEIPKRVIMRSATIRYMVVCGINICCHHGYSTIKSQRGPMYSACVRKVTLYLHWLYVLVKSSCNYTLFKQTLHDQHRWKGCF